MNFIDTKWSKRFLQLADNVATWSKDPSTQVGAVIVDPITKRVVGSGYNGLPRGVEDKPERLERPLKYKFIVHAELNAIINSDTCVRGMHLFCTHYPCHECAKAIVQSGIVSVTSFSPTMGMRDRWSESWDITDIIFKESNVKLFFFKRVSLRIRNPSVMILTE